MKQHRFKRVEAGRDRPSARDHNEAMLILEQVARSGLFDSIIDDTGVHTRRRLPAAGLVDTRLARIVQSLRRADEAVSPAVTAIENYKIKLLSETNYDAWSAGHGTYTKNDKTRHNGLDYKAKVTHESGTATGPDNPSYWECISPDAWILHYQGDNLLEVEPWFQVDDIVEVVQREGRWLICETVIKIEQTINPGTEDVEVVCSRGWNQTDKRAMAVYG